MKRLCSALIALLAGLSLFGCAPASPGQTSQPPSSRQDNIPFAQGQCYAVAHLGYLEAEHLDFYAQRYLDSDALPVHYFSQGDFYLIIPRYSGMDLALYRNDITTGRADLVYQEPDCGPFLIQCNVSDIFPDAAIQLTYEGKTVEFSPFLSLKDGSVQVGDRGLNLTQETIPDN